jgi:threonine aldolase
VTGQLGVHGVQRGALSITNLTEQGTVYTLDEMRRLTGIARDFDIGCHLDGARFSNALVSLGCTPAEMTWKSGFDVVSFGGTKNGLMGVEAVIIFDPSKAWEFELRRKRGGHLLSKHRYLSAQMQAYLSDGLWLDLAARANRAADRLSAGILSVEGGFLAHPQDANMVFAGWPRSGHRRAQAAGAAYNPWPLEHAEVGADSEILTARLVCNWATRDEDIDRFIHLIGG